MPDTGKYNLDYSPKSYWVFEDLKKKVKATVKGDARRLLAESALDGMIPYEPWNFKERLTDEERKAWGAHHPKLMGGEYLPDLEGGEVEIARVSLASVTGDVFSIRARWSRGEIRYSIVDEYSAKYSLSPESSKKPLTMREIIELIDTAMPDERHQLLDGLYDGLVIPPLEYNYDAEPLCLESLQRFVRVSSPFYPELEKWYEEVCQEWYDETLFKDFQEKLADLAGDIDFLSEPIQRLLCTLCRERHLSPKDLVSQFGVPEGEMWLRRIIKQLRKMRT